jgi:glycosyltransferase involved in cell wall biosynthesis
MTRLGLRSYRPGDDPRPRGVPVSVVVLTQDEEANIARCLASVGWADQVVVIDSGSADGTVPLARSLGAEVIEQPWLGFSGQRKFALRCPRIRHDGIYFVDADEWVSPQLAAEIAMRLDSPSCAAYAHRLRLVFQDTWIRHCGWYSGSWVVRLMDRGHDLPLHVRGTAGPTGRCGGTAVLRLPRLVLGSHGRLQAEAMMPPQSPICSQGATHASHAPG